MAKQIYNFELFTNKKEQLRQIRQRRVRRRRAKRFFFLGLLFLLVIILYGLNNSRSDYYVYKEEKNTDSSNEVTWTTFSNGYIKYSSDGVEYQSQFGRAVWNVPVSCQHPYTAQSSSYLLLADKGSNVITLFDVNGKVNTLTLKYPVVQIDVSDQGIMEVIMEGETASYIQVYDKEGKIIAEMKASVDETGYPLAAAISPDGTRLAVSYFTISGMEMNSRITIYDFSQQMQNGSVAFKAGFDHKDCIIPMLRFGNNKMLAAFGEGQTFFYDVSDEPELKRTLEFSSPIESIFEGKNTFGYVLDNSENASEGRYRLCLYSRTGLSKLDVPVDMNYETIRMAGSEIFAYRDNECTIINRQGKVIFQETLKGNHIESILPATGWRNYHVVFSDRIVKMKLKFWGEE